MHLSIHNMLLDQRKFIRLLKLTGDNRKNKQIFHLFFCFRTPGNAKGNLGLNPEADEFVPVFTVISLLIFKAKYIHVFVLLA